MVDTMKFNIDDANAEIAKEVGSFVFENSTETQEVLDLKDRLTRNCCAALISTLSRLVPRVYSSDSFFKPLDDQEIFNLITENGELVRSLAGKEDLMRLVIKVRVFANCAFANIPVRIKDNKSL